MLGSFLPSGVGLFQGRVFPPKSSECEARPPVVGIGIAFSWQWARAAFCCLVGASPDLLVVDPNGVQFRKPSGRPVWFAFVFEFCSIFPLPFPVKVAFVGRRRLAVGRALSPARAGRVRPTAEPSAGPISSVALAGEWHVMFVLR